MGRARIPLDRVEGLGDLVKSAVVPRPDHPEDDGMRIAKGPSEAPEIAQDFSAHDIKNHR